MKKIVLCEKCADKFEQGGMLVGWIKPPTHYGEKQKCQECGKKRYCGECVVGK